MENLGAGSISIVVNGEPREVAERTTVAELVRALGLDAQPVAVERNARVVRKSEHAQCELLAGDRLELVTLVGGG